MRLGKLTLLSVGPALLLAACGGDTGGLTARLDWSRAQELLGRHQRALRTADVPDGVGRLQIEALDAASSTLAETNLYREPAADELPLMESGTWALVGVKAGDDRRIRATAYLSASHPSRYAGQPILGATSEPMVVRAGEITDGGTIRLGPIPGVRYPPLDAQSPEPPNPVRVTVEPEGEALTVEFTQPAAPDVAGYVVAIGSTASVDLPTIARETIVFSGLDLDETFRVEAVLEMAAPAPVRIEELIDGRLYRVVVYAYDDDLDGQQLNYSAPAFQFGLPRDTLAPGAAENLTVTAAGTGTTAISFSAPGEDGLSGTPARYEIRVAGDPALLMDPLAFSSVRAVRPPAPIAPPGTVSFTRPLSELGVRPGDSFSIGVRAVDLAGNTGPISVATYVENPNQVPLVDALVPEVAVSPGELRLLGSNFGNVTGTLSLSIPTATSGPVSLPVVTWSNTEVRTSLPRGLASGQVTIRRPDGMSGAVYLPLLARLDGVVPPFLAPFELIATTTRGTTVSALYRESDVGADYEGAIERLYGELLVAPAAVGNAPLRSPVLAGSYSVDHDLFYFLAPNALGLVESAFVSSSSAAPGLRGVAMNLGGGNQPDALDVVLRPRGLTPGGMVAFSLGGAVRAATVADVRSQSFGPFTVYSSTTAAFDRAALAQSSQGDLLLGYASTTGTVSSLVLATNLTGAPADFVVAPAAAPVRLAGAFTLLVVPDTVGEEFVLVYESLEPGGRTDIRALRLADYGMGAGYAPLETLAEDLRLEDAGVVLRQGQPYLGIGASRLGGGRAELRYVEVHLSELSPGARRVRPTPAGVILDTAATASRARMGCKESPLAVCPLAWLGQGPQVLFLRR